MTPEQARELYATASTPEEAARLLEHRGRPNLGALILTFRHTPRARVSRDLFRIFARNVALGSGAGWFEPGEARTPESVRQVEAAFLWLAEVFGRYAAKQGPEPIQDDTC